MLLMLMTGRTSWADGFEIEGVARDALGRPVAEVTVELQGADGHKIAITASDDAGRFSFRNIAGGTYAVVGSKADFDTATAVVSVEDKAPAPIELALRARTALDMAVTAKQLDEARNQLSPETGSNTYIVNQQAIEDLPQGSDTSFNHVLLQTPGAAQDSYGQVHLRGEHADLQYRINDILLPEGITGFGQVLDTRIAGSVEVLDGALPAQYGYRTAGVVDITTKSGAFTNGGVAEIYGGSWNTIQPSLEYGGSQGPLNFFVSGSYLSSAWGIEGPTNAYQPIHDWTQQDKGFGYFSYVLTPFARVSLITGTAFNTFQIPDNPGQSPSFTVAGAPTVASSQLNENQGEINHYATIALQGTSEDGDFGYQVAPYMRYSQIHFIPDWIGDLEYNGIASDVNDNDTAVGLQGDFSYVLDNQHTLRSGFTIQTERANADNTSLVFPANAPTNGTQTSTTPESIVDSHSKIGNEYGIYLQDEWRLTPKLTVNYGARYDVVNAYVNESAFEPRLNFIYNATETTTVHAGYSKYFTPPPLELVSPTSVAKFLNTTGAQFDTTEEDNVKAERADEFDIGVDQEVGKHLKLGWDNYYKYARDLLDEGQFGAALVFTPFNYAQGHVYGSEVTASYNTKQTTAYFNFAASRALGENPSSQQATFSSDPDELAFAQSHFIYLDHDQTITSSFGVTQQVLRDTKVSVDGIYGTGLREGFDNEETVAPYLQIDAGVIQHLDVIDEKGLDLRATVLNLFDRAYELRSGTGIGVFAPQFGPRRAFFAGVSRQF